MADLSPGHPRDGGRPPKAPVLAEELPESSGGTGLLSRENRHLKWRAFDVIEIVAAVCCALLLAIFTFSTAADVLMRNLGRSVLVFQELTLGSFVWGVFLGSAVALRRRRHFYLTSAVKQMTGARRIVFEVIGLGTMTVIFAVVTWYGFRAFLQGFNVSMQVSTRPLALLTSSLPVFGLLSVAFTLEELINGLRGGFEEPIEGSDRTIDGGAGI